MFIPCLKICHFFGSKDKVKIYLMHVVDFRQYDTGIYMFGVMKPSEIDMSKIHADLLKKPAGRDNDLIEVETIVVEGVPL